MKILTEEEINAFSITQSAHFSFDEMHMRIVHTMREAHRQKRKAVNRRKALRSLGKAYDRMRLMVFARGRKLEEQVELNQLTYEIANKRSNRVQELEKRLDARLIELHETNKTLRDAEDAGEVSLWLESKHPHTTPWLKVRHHLKDEDALLLVEDIKEALGEIGWEQHPEHHLVQLVDEEGYAEFGLMPPPGVEKDALFNSWSNTERVIHMNLLVKALDTLGFGPLSWYQLTLADML